MPNTDEDFQAVADIYHALHEPGKSDRPAYLLALAVYRSRHPDLPEADAQKSVEELIAMAERQGAQPSARNLELD